MRPSGRLFLAIVVAVFAAGCAASRPAIGTVSGESARIVPTTQAGDRRQWLALSQIPGAPVLAPPTQPDTAPAPMEALLLYARAREAELDDQREQATDLLEQACRIDPSSFELQYSLARMYAAGGQEVSADDAQALSALEAAARIEPDHLRLQIDLGREYLAKNNVPEAIHHLRMALLTTEYREESPLAGVADFFLADALQRRGYLRAALDEYRLLVDRLSKPTMAMRADAELGFLLTHLDAFNEQIGDLEEKLGEYPEALATFQSLQKGDPTSVALSARVVACLLGCNRPADAVATAAGLVGQHPDSPEALRVLDEACEGANDLGDRSAEPAEEIARLYQVHPTNHELLFAWVDALQKEGKQEMALQALASASAGDPYDPELLRKRFALLRVSGDADEGGAEKAAQMLIALVTHYPALAEQVEPLWDELLRPGRRPHLNFAELRGLAVPREQEQAKQFFVAYAAEAFGRQAEADAALARANSTGGYAPAAREQLNDIWSAGDWTVAQKIQKSDELARRAGAAGNAELARELQGLALLNEKKASEAIDVLPMGGAVAVGPQPVLEFALAQRESGRTDEFEQSMWTLIANWPGSDQGYAALLNFYLSHGQDEPAQNVMRKWLTADPDNPVAERIEALQLLNSGQADAAAAILARLLETEDNDPQVLEALFASQGDNGHIGPLLDRLNRHAQIDPGNVALAGVLAEGYAKLDRTGDAQRVLDAAAAKLADNSDMLYQLTSFYHRVRLTGRCEQVLLEVLALDPDYAGAANDLGYYWADAGENLARAEALIRHAVAAEPHNIAFLDSLGWVLYKQGKFSEASEYLQKACTPRESADPTVLNHLGDALYRQGKPTEAAAAWQAAAAKITDTDDAELKTLRTQLFQKTQQLQSNQPPDVAPLGGAATQPTTGAAP